MNHRRPAIWIPCVLCALALNALFLIPRPDDRVESSPPDEPQPDFQLRISASRTEVEDQAEPPLTPQEAEAFRLAQAEIAQAGSDHPLTGSYSRDAHFHGSYHQLILGTSTYVLLFVEFGRPNPVPTHSNVMEWGTVSIEQDRIRIHARTERQDSELPREMAWIHAGNWSWLAAITMVPAAFYAGDELDSPFANTWECGYVRDGQASLDGSLPQVPHCYTEERDRLGHLDVLSLIAPEAPNAPWLVRLGPGASAAVARGETLYWDAEERTHVRAIVRESGPQGVVACLMVPDCMSPDAVNIGSTFSRLPRLE